MSADVETMDKVAEVFFSPDAIIEHLNYAILSAVKARRIMEYLDAQGDGMNWLEDENFEAIRDKLDEVRMNFTDIHEAFWSRFECEDEACDDCKELAKRAEEIREGGPWWLQELSDDRVVELHETDKLSL
jgi:hypothetical protein